MLPLRWSSVLALPLALWSTVPGVQWCPVGWAEVRLECFAECSIERSDAPAMIADACGPGAMAASGCPAGLSACGLEPCGEAEESAEELPGGRAYCLSGPLGGEGVPTLPTVAPDPGPSQAIVPESPASDAPSRAAKHPVVRITASPPIAAVGAASRIRAPPGTGRTTC